MLSSKFEQFVQIFAISRWTRSTVQRNSLLKKWDQLDVDPQELQGVIRTSNDSNFYIRPHFIDPYLTRGWKIDSQLLSRLLLL